MPLLTRETLDQERCAVPGCDHRDHGALYLHGKCHPKAATTVHYLHGGIVHVACMKCDKQIADIAISVVEQIELDKRVLACGDPACTKAPEEHSLRLRPGCHRTKGILVVYSEGHLITACAKCREEIQVFHVRHGAPS